VGCGCNLVTEAISDSLPEVALELAHSPRLLLGLDFDGTLAPIVADPVEASLPGETHDLLDALAARPGTTVAIISGRALEDLRRRVSPKLILSGNHGLEMLEHGIYWRHPLAARCAVALQAVCEKLADEIRDIPGAFIENKTLTASVHYRKVAERDQPRLMERVKTALAHAGEDCVLPRHGDKVIEIHPAIAWNKGSAMLRILARMQEAADSDISVCYIGDDTTDEDAFRSLAGAVTIRVCRDCSTDARFRVKDPVQVREFLNRILLPMRAAQRSQPVYRTTPR
jgi:trehalose 6-phosphate phosphatase